MNKAKLENIASGFMFAIIFVVSNAWSAPEEISGSEFVWKDGFEIYAKICAYCHEAHVGPPIRNRELPSEYIHAVVRNGSRAMPAFRSSEIDDESLVKLADFISKKEVKH